MDADNDSYTEVDAVDQNCVVGKNQSVGPQSVSEVVTGICDARLERMVENTTDDVAGQTNGSAPSEKVETKECKEPEPPKVHTKGKCEKPSNTKNGTRVSTNKITNTPNGSLAANTQSKQPVMKTKSFNDRLPTNSDLIKGTKVTPATSNTRKDKLQKSEMGPSSGNLVQSEGNEEKSTMNPLPEGSASISEGDNESVESAKSHKVGKLPSYGFSFKCHERAEKRKEFYTKLEERIHAQEIEKNNQQAKSKESQQAEIKMLRKSLNFKATPMPTFYQEPPPPKVELKKMPITRPRSPKLGRKKNPSSVGDSDQISRPARLSLDEKVVCQHPAQRPGPIHSKQPQRKSLPRLRSEKTRISKTGPDATSAGTPPIADIKEEASLPKEFVPIARLNDGEVQVSDLGFVPVARVEDGDLLSDPDATPEKDETHVTLKQEPTSLQ